MFACPLSTRETVMWETPAVIATWRILGRSGADRVLTAPPSRSWACLPRTFIMPDQTGSAPQRGPPDRTGPGSSGRGGPGVSGRSEEHTSELQSRGHLVCRLLL